MPSADALRKLGSVGLLLPNLEARLVLDMDGLVDAKEGESGELWIKGPSVMKVSSIRTLGRCNDQHLP
jgi:acyl-CoA synthetase (AMP-forming)/AMP-acid ligase II